MFKDMEKQGKANKDLNVVIVQDLIYGKNHTTRNIVNRFGLSFG
jgi:hypothetical protein